MVMYRDFAQRKARTLDLVGFVCNNTDGTVTVVAQGKRESLERYGGLLKKGSILSRVSSVEIVWRQPTETYKGFSIAY